MKEIEKNYDSNIKDFEAIKIWEEQDFFEPEKYEKLMNSKGKPVNKPFVMTLPPPNANGDLHLGHMIGYSFQDCMGRYNRLKGRPVLLLPGKDHAGIQTEAVYTKMLEQNGKNKWDVGREEFYKGCYDFCIEKSVNARTQEKRIGLSADWNREKFTLDPKLTEVIYDTFVKMVEDGLVYRGKYIINQCPHCRTALADVDTEHKEMRGILAQIVYPFADPSDEKLAEKEWNSGKKFLYNEQEIITPPSTKGITVATTRPETMLGDTAVAVHPDDPRYKKFIGKKVLLPFMNKEIEIIADEDLDPIFGTGALKVTPAHSPIDFKIGKKHGLDIVNVIDEEGKMCSPAPDKFIGMNGIDCSKALCAELKEQDLLLKIENIKHEVTVCERCNTPIEPIISKQWFVNAKPLADEVLKRLKNGECKVVPAGQQKALEFFLSNIEPWCISRQLWWGHRIPVWYSGGKKLYDTLLDLYEKEKGSELRPGEYDKLPQNEIDKLISKYKIEAKGSGRIVASANKPDDEGNWEQEIDVFDTWFSSGQWPFSTLGGPDGDDFKKYYPTDVLETMRDILYLWVSRMMMLGTYRTGKMPFHTVYLHGMVLAPDGTKMSKSKGNGVEPKEIINKYGADALRLWYLNDTMAGGNSPIREENIKAHRNFVNKIWNAFRFVLTNIENSEFEAINEKISFIGKDFISLVDFDLLRKSLKISEEWESRVVETEASISKVEKNISRYRFNLASMEMREFFWHTVCDKWIEEVKLAVKDSEIGAENRIEQFSLLLAVMIAYLKIMHPFIPFVTEIVMGILSRH